MRIPALRRAPGALLVLAAAAGCSDTSGYDTRLYGRHHATRPAASSSRTARWQEIVAWTTDPGQKESVGFLETRETTLEGTLDPTTQYFVYDRNQTTPFGYINAVGVTHVWRRQEGGGGRWLRIGEYSLESAVKELFKRSFKSHVGFAPMEWVPLTD